jgi:hypothetical protein
VTGLSLRAELQKEKIPHVRRQSVLALGLRVNGWRRDLGGGERTLREYLDEGRQKNSNDDGFYLVTKQLDKQSITITKQKKEMQLYTVFHFQKTICWR